MNLPVLTDCWNQIGVKGDGSCAELVEHVHCQNCPVFGQAGRRLFDREPPADYVDEWTRQLAVPEAVAEGDAISLLVFRCAGEWLALDVQTVVEVGEPRVVHAIPHRSNRLLLGLVNVRGELHLCVALSELLGLGTRSRIGTKAVATTSGNVPVERLLLVSQHGRGWAFTVDEVAGVLRFPLAAMMNVPVTVTKGAETLSRGVFEFEKRMVGFLDDSRLFDSLRRAIG